MKATLVFIVLALVFTSNALEAVCNFDGDSFVGYIWLEELEGTLSFSFDFQDPNNLLFATGNAIHVHQYGFLDGEGCGPTATGGHYNPVLNYGELSGHFGKFDNDTTLDFTFQSTEISLLGEFGIAGRSLVIHHGVTAARLGCCNIIIYDVTDLPDSGITRFEEGIGMCGDNVTLTQVGNDLTITNNNDDVYLFLLPALPACDKGLLLSLSLAPPGSYFNMTAGEELTIDVTDQLALTGNNGLAGFSCATVPPGDFSSPICSPIILKTAQDNVNDVYEETDMTNDSTSDTSGDMTGDMTDMTDDMTDDMSDMTDMTDMTGSTSQAVTGDDDDDDDDSSTVSLFISAVFALAALL